MRRARKRNIRNTPKKVVAVEKKTSGQTTDKSEDISYEGDPVDTDSEPAFVTVGGSVTKNLGNYNSCRVEVKLTLPCEPKDKDKAYDEASAWVDARIAKELEVATGEGGDE